jgi:hypothetical protein
MVGEKKTLTVDSSVLGKSSRLEVPVKFASSSSMLCPALAAGEPYPAAATGKILQAVVEVHVGRDAGKPSRRTGKLAAA